jgi:hypothetical protein
MEGASGRLGMGEVEDGTNERLVPIRGLEPTGRVCYELGKRMFNAPQ